MTDYNLSEALDDCITRLAQGEHLENCLRDYPSIAPQLRPMLEAGLIARRAGVGASEIAQAKDRVRFRIEQYHRHTRPPAGLARVSGGLLLIIILHYTAGYWRNSDGAEHSTW